MYCQNIKIKQGNLFAFLVQLEDTKAVLGNPLAIYVHLDNIKILQVRAHASLVVPDYQASPAHPPAINEEITFTQQLEPLASNVHLTTQAQLAPHPQAPVGNQTSLKSVPTRK